MAAKEEKRNIDVWLIAVIVLLILSIGGGLYVTGQAILSRVEALSVQTRSGMGRLETEVFELRKQVQSMELKVDKLSKKPQVASPPDKAKPAPAGP
jgi:peptidoglycan hydrolase CwlO-like protein